MPTIRIPAPLRKLTSNLEEIQVTGGRLDTSLAHLNSTYPGLTERLLDEQGGVRRFVNIFVNDEDIRFLQGKETPVRESDVISIVPAQAGG